MVQREPNIMPERPRVTQDSEPFQATGEKPPNKQSKPEKQGYVVQIDNNELLDTMVKSVVGGVATGFVMNRLMD